MTALDLVKKHEGVRLKPYYDTTEHLTIGYGRSLSSRGISLPEAEYLLANDLKLVNDRLERLSWYLALDPERQAVMVDIAFNVGFNGLLEFVAMITALMDKDWERAAVALLHSKWAVQVGNRAVEDAAIIRNGQ